MACVLSSRGSLALAAVLALAACNKSGDKAPANGQSAEGGSPQAAMASGPALNPGQWQSSIKVTRMDLGGDLPPQAKAAIAKSMGVEQTSSTCLTPEEAAKPRGGFINRDPNCTYEGFSMADGKISGTASCKREGMVQTMTMSGSFGSDDYEVHVDSKAKGPGGMDMNTSMTIKAHRTGPCTGKTGT